MSSSFALVVEDEYDISIIFAQALRAAGFETEIARSGDLAIARLASVEPDVVVLDLHLPRVPGTTVLKRIRSDPRLSGACVIVATAHPQLAEEVRGEADWVLYKPITFGQLRNLARNLVPNLSLAGGQDR